MAKQHEPPAPEPQRPNGEYAVIRFQVRLMWKALMCVIAAFGVALLARLISMLMGHG